MNKILTISIAAYNMENYIRQALESIIDDRIIQDLEVFVVDDGGKDHTLDIAKEYAEKYPHSIFPIHKENGGFGSTVNYSIDHASGKYFKLLDGDDWFDKEGLYQLVITLREANEDVLISPYYYVFSNGEKSKKNIDWRGEFRNRRIPEFSTPKFRFGLPSTTFKLEILKKSGVHLPEHVLYTDVIYSTVPFSVANTIGFLDQGVYCYRIGRKGQSISPEVKLKHTQTVLDHCESLFIFYETQREKKCDNIQYIANRVANYYIQSALRYLFLPTPSKENLRRIVTFEKKMKKISPELFLQISHLGKIGMFMNVCRHTAYLPYWLTVFIPRRLINRHI